MVKGTRTAGDWETGKAEIAEVSVDFQKKLELYLKRAVSGWW